MSADIAPGRARPAPPPRLLLQVAAFELGQQLRSHVFWVVFGLSVALVFGSVTIPQIHVGPPLPGPRNGPQAVVRLHLLWSLFYLFTAAAFAADAVLRDALTRFEPILRTTPVDRREYAFGRWLGATGAVAVCFLGVPLGLIVGSSWPGREAARFGPEPWGAYVHGLFALAGPNLLVACALFFALATIARSMMAAYVGAVALLMLYGLGGGFAFAPAGSATAALIEPFGAAAEGTPWLLANRALWLTVGAGALALAIWRSGDDQPSGVSISRPEPQARKAVPAHRELATPVAPRFGSGTTFAQLLARTRLEIGQVVRSPAFGVLMLLGFFNAGAALWSAGAGADTGRLIARLIDAFRLVPILVALVYAGELMWSERESRIEGLVAAAPLPTAALLAPKLAAIAITLGGLLLASAATLAGVQGLRSGWESVRLDQLASWYLLPRAYDWLLPAILAVFLQAVSPSKMAGWGWMVLYLIASLTLENLGLTGGLYRYGGHLDGPLADTIGPRAPANAGLLRLYWGAFAALLVTLSLALWGRGLESPSGRLRRAAERLRGPLGWAGAAALLAWAGFGLKLALA